MGNKSTHAETQSRVATIYRLLLNGLRRREIIQYVSENTDWGVSERSVDNYIKQATAEISEINKSEKIAAYGMARRRLDDLYFKSMKINDYKTCLQIQKELNVLEGMKTVKTEFTGNVQFQPVPNDVLTSEDWAEYTRLRRDEIKQRKRELRNEPD